MYICACAIACGFGTGHHLTIHETAHHDSYEAMERSRSNIVVMHIPVLLCTYFRQLMRHDSLAVARHVGFSASVCEVGMRDTSYITGGAEGGRTYIGR